MDPITRLLVFTGGFAATVVVTSVVYRRITGKPFITVHSGRPDGGDVSKPDSPLNKQMSPFSGGAISGTIVFTYILYKSHDIVYALLVGGVAFAVLYWVMWAGQHLEHRTKNKSTQTEEND